MGVGLRAAYANVANVQGGRVFLANRLAYNGDVVEGFERISQDRFLRGFRDLQSLGDGLYRAIKYVFRFHARYIVTSAPIPVFLGVNHVCRRRMFFKFVIVCRRIVGGASLLVERADVLHFASKRDHRVI